MENLTNIEKIEILLKGLLKFIVLNGTNLILALVVTFIVLVVITKIKKNKYWLRLLIEKNYNLK